MKIDNNWHIRSVEDICETLKTDAARGLTRKEASKRSFIGGGNKIWRVKRASASEFAMQMLLDLATILLVIFSVVAAIFDKNSELFAILSVVVIGCFLRIIAYIRSQRIFEEKARGVIPRVNTVRNAESCVCSAEELAEGDVILLETGDTVPADARIIYSAGLFVYENKMTENKAVVFKNADTIIPNGDTETPIEKRDNMLYAGSTVIAGEARAIVVATGKKTLAAAKFGTLLIPSGEKLKLLGKLTKWCRIGSLVMIAAVLVITLVGALVHGISPVELLLTSLALAVASMSEFLTVIGCMILAVSVRKADSEECGRAKIKDVSSVEEMDKVDTIVLESAAMIKAGDITLHSYYVGDRFVNVDEPAEGYSPAELLKFCYATTGILPQGTLNGGIPTPERANTSVDYAGIRKVFDEYFASSHEARGMENTILVGHEPAGTPESGGLDTVLICRGGNYEAIVSGSVDGVLSCCSGIRKNGQAVPFTREDLAKIKSETDRLRSRGIYTIGIARRDSPYINMNRVSALQMCMTFEGFIALSDRAYGDTLDVIRKCREGATKIVCFTEGSDEDKAFLEMIEFLTDKDRYITLDEAASSEEIKLCDGQFAAIATGYAGAAKRRREFLRKLVKGGNRISYISKDPEDMFAMKDAPVSFAVPAAAKKNKTIPQSIRASSDVVVIPKNGGGVFEAFRVIEYAKSAMLNLKRCAHYLIAAQIARLIYVIVSVETASMKIADPVQLLLWGLIFDLAIVTVIAFRDPPWNMISVKEEDRKLPSKAKDFIYPAVVGIIWGLLIVSVPSALLVYGAENGTLSEGVLSGTVFSSAILSIPAVGGELMTNGSIFKKSKRRSKAIPCSFLLSVLISMLFALSKGAASFAGAENIPFRYYLLSFIPACTAIVAFEIMKAVKSAKNKKDESDADDGITYAQ